ncbi:MAG: lamin tail domain-containing protein [Myxococcota bacterium]
MRSTILCVLVAALCLAACDSGGGGGTTAPDANGGGPDAADVAPDAPDPCEGVVCDEGTPSECDGDQIVVYDDAGSCGVESGAAVCAYPEASRVDCSALGKICAGGECVDPPKTPCEIEVCADPPPPDCDGDTARVYVTFGDCSEQGGEAVCDYPVQGTLECAADGKVCRNGGCAEEVIDPCDPNPCTVPPAPHCTAGDRASFPPDTGTCTPDGEVAVCDWSDHDTDDCPAQDQECHAGACADGAAAPEAAGDVVVTEILVNPAASGDPTEWLELHNPGTIARRLDGCVLADRDVDDHAIPSGADVVVPAGGHIVLARTGDAEALGGWEPDYVYGEEDLALANTADELLLRCGELIVDEVAWDKTWPLQSGAALSLDPGQTGAGANDDASSWCAASDTYSGTLDKGTPREANPACP